jgi:1,4-dihydroxy-2-naphthoyl-CoA hydrolase
MDFLIKPSPQELNNYCKNTIADFLGIEFIETGDNYLIARMPVNERTQQPLGLLHGGASCVLAEQAGSMAANLFLNRDTHVALGLDINANHLKAARKGYVFAKAIPIHIGARTQVWEIKITDEKNELTCISRLTMAVIPVSPDTQRKQELIS